MLASATMRSPGRANRMLWNKDRRLISVEQRFCNSLADVRSGHVPYQEVLANWAFLNLGTAIALPVPISAKQLGSKMVADCSLDVLFRCSVQFGARAVQTRPEILLLRSDSYWSQNWSRQRG